MDALVTAGGIPQPGEPLYEYTRGAPKALLEICGKPMLQWVLDALSEALQVERVIIVGLEENPGLECRKLAAWLPNQGDMLENLRAGVIRTLEVNPQAQYVLAVSSDVPAMQPHMLDWVVSNALLSQDDIYYHVTRRETMEAAFPNSKRTYTRLKDMQVCGADVNVVRTMTVTGNDALWKRIIAARKNVLKQAALIGFDTLFLLLIRQLTLEEAARRASRRLGIRGRAVVCPYAELGMDVDKPYQLELMRAHLSRRAETAHGGRT
jgi:GTP:adenosylcobinamide-phosphate guanylyltransferase